MNSENILQPFRYLAVKVHALFNIIELYDNWPTVIISRLRGVRSGEVEYHLRNGLIVLVRTDSLSEGRVVDNTFRGEYEYPGFEIGAGDTVVDIGAHIGAFSLYAAAKAYMGAVISFEPSRFNFRQLKKNIKLNRLGNVKIDNRAVFNRKKQVTLYLNYASSALYSLFKKNTQWERVQAVTLAYVFETYRLGICNFLKIDCEGAEYEILTSAPDEILRKINRLVFEYHPRVDKRKKLDNIRTHLERNGLEYMGRKKNIVFFKRQRYYLRKA